MLLAIMLLALVLSPPDGSPNQFRTSMTPVRGAMIERRDHPEWRQFLIRAAIQRADELNRLRDLPDTPVQIVPPPVPAPPPPIVLLPPPASTPDIVAVLPPAPAPEIVALPSAAPKAAPQADLPPSPAPQIAALPDATGDPAPEADDTASIAQPPAATIPVDIGEASSVELPVVLPEERPPVIKTQQIRSRSESRTKRPRHVRARPRPQQDASFNFFSIFFNDQNAGQPRYNQQQYYAGPSNYTPPAAARTR